MKMGTKEDPDERLMTLEDMRREQLINAGSTMTEDELLEHIFSNPPKEYEIVAYPLKKRVEASTDPVTIEEIRHDLNLKYKKMYGVKKMTIPMKKVKLLCKQAVSGAGAMSVARLATKRMIVRTDNNNKEKVTTATIDTTRTSSTAFLGFSGYSCILILSVFKLLII
jgi:hypothetical protein